MPFHSLQTAFNSGVLDPRLASRKDIKHYYQGVEIGKNVLCVPQGGMKRRPGMAFVHDIGLDGYLGEFAFNTEQTYLLVFTDLNVEIFRNGVSQANVVTPWTLAQLSDLRWTQSADTMILVQEDNAPRKLVRGATHTSWTLSNITFDAIPQYDYNDASSPASVDEVQQINFSGSWTGGETYALNLDGEITDNITFANSASVDEERIRDALRALPNTSSTGISVANGTGAFQFNVTFSGADGGEDWPLISISAGSGGSVTQTTQGVSGKEDLWGSTRGYPKTATFHEGRLWFGGFKSRPQSLAASVTNAFFDFDLGTGLDDQAILVTLDTDQVNAITGLFSGRHLQVFTTGGEFYVPASPNNPITPGNIRVPRQTLHGCNGLQPISIDGSTLFVERSGKSIREFYFTDAEDSYTAPAVSLLASHLVGSPVDIAALRGTSDDVANYVYVVNSDGTMAVLNTLRSEEVLGWSSWETAGQILSVAVVVDEVYFLVKRTINSATKYYLERADVNTYTDANSLQNITPSTTVNNLSHLNGEVCRVRADGAIMTNATPSGGSITLSRDGASVEVGLDFDPEIKTLRLNVDFKNGPTMNRDKRVICAQVDMYESLGIIVNGERLPDRTFPVPLDEVPEPFTGVKEIYLLGWSKNAQVSITQDDPLPMHIRAIDIELETS